MGMSIEAVKAKHGDALILREGGTVVLIDGGARGVWNRFLKRKVEALGSGAEPPELDLVMVSHIDSDHIAGVIDMTEDMIEADETDTRPPVEIRRAWVNTFTDAILEAGIETEDSDPQTEAASVASTFEGLDLPDLDTGHTELMLASVGQGRTLARNLKTLRIPVNRHFGGGFALADAAAEPWSKGGLEIEVIGPTRAELDALREAWKEALPKILEKEAEAETAAATLDTSVYNLASIVAIARAGGRSILLTGDARGDMIETWLDAKGLTGPQHFDVLKLPHHGSDRNVSLGFFERVTADHYLISGDGNHGNPEPAVFDMIFAARGDADYRIHLTYDLDEIKGHRSFKADDTLDCVFARDAWRKDKLASHDPGRTSLVIAL